MEILYRKMFVDVLFDYLTDLLGSYPHPTSGTVYRSAYSITAVDLIFQLVRELFSEV